MNKRDSGERARKTTKNTSSRNRMLKNSTKNLRNNKIQINGMLSRENKNKKERKDNS